MLLSSNGIYYIDLNNGTCVENKNLVNKSDQAFVLQKSNIKILGKLKEMSTLLPIRKNSDGVDCRRSENYILINVLLYFTI